MNHPCNFSTTWEICKVNFRYFYQLNKFNMTFPFFTQFPMNNIKNSSLRSDFL